MRYFVVPTDPFAQIPDPERGGFIPAAGVTLSESGQLRRLIQRGDVTATPLDAAVPGTPLDPTLLLDADLDTLPAYRGGQGRRVSVGDLEAFLVSPVRAIGRALAQRLRAQANLSDLTDKQAARASLELANVDNTSDADKPVSTAAAKALADKLDAAKLGTTALTAPNTTVARSLGDRFVDRVNLWDFCEKSADGRTADTSAGFYRALAFVTANKRRRIDVPGSDCIVKFLNKADYTANGSRVGLLVDAAGRDIEIHGEGGRLLFDGANRGEYGNTLGIVGAGEVSLTGSMDMGYVRPSFVQGACTAINTTNKTADFSLEVAPSWTGVQRLCEYDPITGLYTATILERPDTFAPGRTLQALGGSAYRLDFSGDATALGAMGVGRTYVLMHQIYACDAIHALKVRRLNIAGNWRILHSASMGLSVNQVGSVVVGPGFSIEAVHGALLAAPADGIHINDARHRVEINARRLSALCDDAINVSTLYRFVVATTSSTTTFQVGNATGGYDPLVGDRLVLQRADGTAVSLGAVTAVDTSVYPSAVTVSIPLAGGFTSGQIVTSTSQSAPIAINVGLIDNIRGNGVVARSARRVDIRGRIRDTTDAAVAVVSYGFPEGPYPQQISVDVDCRNVSRLRSPAIWVAAAKDAPVPPVGSVGVVGIKAQIDLCSNTPVLVQSASSVTVAVDLSNTNYNPAAGGANGDKAVLLDTCAQVVVEGRRVGGTGTIHALNCTNVTTGELVGLVATTNTGAAVPDFLGTTATGRAAITAANAAALATAAGVGSADAPMYANVSLYSGGNTGDAGGSVSFGIGLYPTFSPMASIKGVLGFAPGTELQGGLAFLTRAISAAGQVLTERARLTSGGNFGIGTTSPTEKLDVVGNIKGSGTGVFGGALMAGGQLAANQAQKAVLDYYTTDRSVRIMAYSHDGTAANIGFWSASANGGATRVAFLTPSGTLSVTGDLNTSGSLRTGSNLFLDMSANVPRIYPENGSITFAVNTMAATRYIQMAADGFLRVLNGGIVSDGPIRTGIYTVATLPTAGVAGRGAYCTNARNAGEAAGAGTGSPVADNGNAWRIPNTTAAVAA